MLVMALVNIRHKPYLIFILYIEKEKKFQNLKIAFVGDLKYGRTIHSLIKLLHHYQIELVLVAPIDISLPETYRKELKTKNITFTETEDINKVLDCDVIYVTRIQQERFAKISEYELLKNSYIINLELIKKSKSNPLIMHPLPRVNELSTDIDNLENAAYFRMAHYGVSVRMALLLLCLDVNL